MSLWEIVWTVVGGVEGILIGIVFSVLGMTPPEFKFARGCFWFAGTLLGGTEIMWAIQTGSPTLWRMIVGGIIGMTIGIGLPEGIRWVYAKEHAWNVKPNSVVSPKSFPTATPTPISVADSHAAEPKITHRPAPITKVDKFATIVPFDPTNKNVPIPMNADFDDGNSRYYSDLLAAAGRPTQQNDGKPWPNDRDFDRQDSRTQFIGRLLQYYVLRSIDELQRDSEGIQWKAGQGSKPIIRVGIAPPDRASYPSEDFVAEIAKTGFLRPMDELFWKNRSIDFPRHTKISLLERPTSPTTGAGQYIVKFERPQYFSVEFKITQTLGPITVTGVSGASLPKGFQPAVKVDSVVGYPFIITMNYEIQRTAEDDFRPDAYVAWAAALFTGLKQRMEN